MDNSQMARIWQYRDFWDIPLIFFVVYQDRLYLFDCPFDSEAEDYLDNYSVYKMPSLTEEDLSGSWVDLPKQALVCLGTVPLSSVGFDETRKKAVDASILTPLIVQAAVAG